MMTEEAPIIFKDINGSQKIKVKREECEEIQRYHSSIHDKIKNIRNQCGFQGEKTR